MEYNKSALSLYTIYGMVESFNRIKGVSIVSCVSGSEIYFELDGKKSVILDIEQLEKLKEENYSEFTEIIYSALKNLSYVDNVLPSAFQIGQKNILVSFGTSGEIKNCEVVRVHFTDRKVMYDLDIPVKIKGSKETYHTRIYNIDSAFLTSKN